MSASAKLVSTAFGNWLSSSWFRVSSSWRWNWWNGMSCLARKRRAAESTTDAEARGATSGIGTSKWA